MGPIRNPGEHCCPAGIVPGSDRVPCCRSGTCGPSAENRSARPGGRSGTGYRTRSGRLGEFGLRLHVGTDPDADRRCVRAVFRPPGHRRVLAKPRGTKIGGSMAVVDSGPVVPMRTLRGGLPPSMVERMTLILDAFDGPVARPSLDEVASRTRLPRSTVHRILDQLVRLDWVEHGSPGYRLGRRALGLGGGDGGHGRIRAVAAPLLHDLHLRTAMVVHLSVLDGGEIIYLDKVGGRLAADLPSRVGGRAPAYSTAGGKSMLAWLDPERVDALYRHGLDE